tara:strand:+ start:61 stop:510 length:450 start_codon:yes stop_codon:yes gene_type:complete
MKYLLIVLLLFTYNCTLNKVSNTHGFRLIEEKYSKILINKTNKNDIRKLIGPPSSMSKFEDIWFYIERQKTNQSIFKLGKKKIYRNNIVLIEFNSMGLVSSKKLLNLNDMNDIKIAEKLTEKKFSQNNTLYNILTTLREKVNAPTRRKK